MKLAGRLGGAEDKLKKISHPKSDDSMMLVMMIGWQFLAKRPGGRLAGRLSVKLAGKLAGERKSRKFSQLKEDDSMMLVTMIGWHFLAGVAGRRLTVKLAGELAGGAGMLSFTMFGEHDALKSDEQNCVKVIPLSSETPTYDVNRCSHITLTCPPLGS